MIWELFYPHGLSREHSTLQWATNHWYRDKTTKLIDFHSLEDLTIHSYRARIIAILKPWIQERALEKLRLHHNKEFGNWLGQLMPTN